MTETQSSSGMKAVWGRQAGSTDHIHCDPSGIRVLTFFGKVESEAVGSTLSVKPEPVRDTNDCSRRRIFPT